MISGFIAQILVILPETYWWREILIYSSTVAIGKRVPKLVKTEFFKSKMETGQALTRQRGNRSSSGNKVSDIAKWSARTLRGNVRSVAYIYRDIASSFCHAIEEHGEPRKPMQTFWSHNRLMNRVTSRWETQTATRKRHETGKLDSDSNASPSSWTLSLGVATHCRPKPRHQIVKSFVSRLYRVLLGFPARASPLYPGVFFWFWPPVCRSFLGFNDCQRILLGRPSWHVPVPWHQKRLAVDLLMPESWSQFWERFDAATGNFGVFFRSHPFQVLDVQSPEGTDAKCF